LEGEIIMENSLKAVLIGAGVVITLIVVSIGFILMRSGQTTALAAIGKLDQLNVDMTESQYTMYNNMEISGSEVINVIRKFEDEYIGVKVETKKHTVGVWYINTVNVTGDVGKITGAATDDISVAIDEKSSKYVNPNGVFLGKLVRDENGTIVALVFTQQ
jgi:maltose-binding protein MalE